MKDSLRRLLQRVGRMTAALAVLLPLAAAAADRPLVFGVFPYTTAQQIVATYGPLAGALEKALGRPVAVYSARDFKTFVERTRQGDYDILLTAPHLAWLARQDAGYRPLLKYAEPTRGLLVVKAVSPLDRPAALRGRTIAAADPVAIVVLAMRSKLASEGLGPADYRATTAGTHFNAVMQVINGRADAAMLGMHPYLLLQPELRAQLRVVAETPPLSSLMFLAHPRLDDAEAEAMRQALSAFGATPEGAAFMQRGGYGGFAPVDGSELPAFRSYALEARKMLQGAR